MPDLSLLQVYSIGATLVFFTITLFAGIWGWGHQGTKMRIACLLIVCAAYSNACECLLTVRTGELRIHWRADFMPIQWALPVLRIACMIPVALTSSLQLSTVIAGICLGMLDLIRQFSAHSPSFSFLWDDHGTHAPCLGWISCQGIALAYALWVVMFLALLLLIKLPYMPWATAVGMLELFTQSRRDPFDIIPLGLCDMSILATSLLQGQHSTLLFMCSTMINMMLLLYALFSVGLRTVFFPSSTGSPSDGKKPKRA
jgi:hypothetical protein